MQLLCAPSCWLDFDRKGLTVTLDDGLEVVVGKSSMIDPYVEPVQPCDIDDRLARIGPGPTNILYHEDQYGAAAQPFVTSVCPGESLFNTLSRIVTWKFSWNPGVSQVLRVQPLLASWHIYWSI